jgi:hypothetical protein
VQFALCVATGLPSGDVMPLTMIGSQCTPRAANVAYASAIESGVTSATPRVKDGMYENVLTRSSPLDACAPAAVAMRAAWQMPATASSCTK